MSKPDDDTRHRSAQLPPVIPDAAGFARRGESLAGKTPIAVLPRVRDALADPSGELRWHAAGALERDVHGETASFLRLAFEAGVRMRCVRCLEPVAIAVEAQRQLKLVRDEEQAEREDAEVDEYDVIAAAPGFDLAELLQDELLLALPFAPAHADCTAPGQGAGHDEASEPGPFAALAALRGRGRR